MTQEALRSIPNGTAVLAMEDDIPDLPLQESLTLDDLRRINFPGRSMLTRREYEVLLHIVGGRSSKAIAQALAISIKTVEVHRINLREKLNVRNTCSLMWLFLTGARAPYDPSPRYDDEEE